MFLRTFSRESEYSKRAFFSPVLVNGGRMMIMLNMNKRNAVQRNARPS